MKTVEQVMITNVVTVDAGRMVADAVALMLDQNISLLPVIDGERLVGLITMRDLLRSLPYRRIVDVMQQNVVTVSPSMPITIAYALMDGQRVGQLPVVDQDRVVGLITIEGILRELGLPVDPLTELPWGTALRARAVESLKDGHEIAIVFLDLDNFGLANKQFGHVVGDRSIKTVAEALLATIDSSTDLLCRYGGDEFAVLTTRGREEAEELGRRALEAIAAIRPPGATAEFTLTASMGISGGKRTTEREDVHFEATVDDLITMASRQTTQAKVERSGRVSAATGGDAPAGPRLYLQRVNLATVRGEVTATVELSLGPDRFTGEVKGPGLGMAPWRLLAYSTVQAVNQVLPDGWRAAVDEVRIVGTATGNLVVVTLYLGSAEGTSDRFAGCALVDSDVGPAVVKATLQAINRRLGFLLV